MPELDKCPCYYCVTIRSLYGLNPNDALASHISAIDKLKNENEKQRTRITELENQVRKLLEASGQ